MTWSLNAHGVTGDANAVERLIHELRSVLANKDYGTGGSQFSGLTGLHNDFHLDVEPPQSAAQLPSGGQGDSSPPADETGGPSGP